MYIKRVVLLMILVVMAGCGPKCLPSPEVPVDVPFDKPLPFRVSGVTFDIKPGSPLSEDRVVVSEKGFLALRKMTEKAFFDSALVSPDATEVVTVRVLLSTMFAGTRKSLFNDSKPAKYEATYQVVDPDSGAVLFEKSYSNVKVFEMVSDYGCLSMNEGFEALYNAIHVVNNQFIADLYAIQPKAATDSQGRLKGTLGVIKAQIPWTKDNIYWVRQLSGNHDAEKVHKTCTVLRMDFPREVTRQLQEEQVFDHSSGNTYDVTIVIPSIWVVRGGWFGDPSNRIEADAVIYRNGVEVGSVEWSKDECPDGVPLQEILDKYRARIIKAIAGMQQGEAQ